MGADFLENLGKTITKTAEKVGKKAEEVVGVQKLRSQLAGTEREIDKNCQDLGEIVYRHFIDGEVMSEEIAIVCDEITRLRNQAADLREQIAQQRGESICPSCGAHGPKEMCIRDRGCCVLRTAASGGRLPPDRAVCKKLQLSSGEPGEMGERSSRDGDQDVFLFQRVCRI